MSLSSAPPLVRSGLLPGKYLLSGRSGDTGKAGVAGGVSCELLARRRPTRGLGGTAAPAPHRGPRPIRGLVGCGGGASRLLLPGARRCRAGLGGVLVATVRCRVLGLPGTLWTPTTFTWAPPEGEAARAGGPRLQLQKQTQDTLADQSQGSFLVLGEGRRKLINVTTSTQIGAGLR